MNSIWQQIWPDELAVLKNNPKAIPMAIGPYLNLCQNCGGFKTMMVYVIEDGPFTQADGRKLKWLDLPPDADNPITPTKSGWYTGELRVASCPVCCQGQLNSFIVRNCGLSGQELNVSLADFCVDGALLSGKAEALAVCNELLTQGRNVSGFITLVGAYGVGKSHLLKGLVNGFRQMGVLAKYTSMGDLLSSIRDQFGDNNGVRAAESAVETYQQARILAIDEVDRVNLTGWAKETLFRLLNRRFEDSCYLLTIMATNTKPDEFPSELGYLGSRMRGGLIVDVPGPDMRPGIALHRKSTTQTVLSIEAEQVMVPVAVVESSPKVIATMSSLSQKMSIGDGS